MKDEKIEVVKKKDKPECPAIYIDGVVNMSSASITTEFDFIQIWGLHRKGQDMKKAFKKARAWRDRYK